MSNIVNRTLETAFNHLCMDFVNIRLFNDTEEPVKPEKSKEPVKPEKSKKILKRPRCVR